MLKRFPEVGEEEVGVEPDRLASQRDLENGTELRPSLFSCAETTLLETKELGQLQKTRHPPRDGSGDDLEERLDERNATVITGIARAPLLQQPH